MCCWPSRSSGYSDCPAYRPCSGSPRPERRPSLETRRKCRRSRANCWELPCRVSRHSLHPTNRTQTRAPISDCPTRTSRHQVCRGHHRLQSRRHLSATTAWRIPGRCPRIQKRKWARPSRNCWGLRLQPQTDDFTHQIAQRRVAEAMAAQFVEHGLLESL